MLILQAGLPAKTITQVRMKNVYSYKEIWHIAYPILISLIIQQMIGLTDTAFLGRVGEVELGASAIAGVFYIAVYMLGFGFSVGTQILIARRNGAGRLSEIGQIFYQGVYFQIALSLAMFLITKYASPLLLSRIISSPHVYHATMEFLNWRVLGFFFSFQMVMFRAFYVGTTQTRPLTFNSILMLVVNAGLNYVLIFGKLGLPALGIAGSAIGSSLSEMVSLLFFVGYMRTKTDIRRFGLNVIPRFKLSSLRKILSISIWTMIQNFVSLSTWFIFFIFIEHLGEESLAVANIVRSVSGITFMMIMAFAATCSSLVGNLMGAGRPEAVMPTIRQHVRMSYLLIMPFIVVYAIFPSWIARIYTDIPGLITQSVPVIWSLCTAYLVMIPANIYFQAVSGTGNTQKAFLMELVALIVYTAYGGCVIMEMRSSVAVAWTTEHVYALLIGLFSYWYLKKGNWKNKKL